VTRVELGPLQLWIPDWATLDPFALFLAAAAAIALLRFKIGLLPVLGGAVLLGALWRLAFGG
jgi:chromate transporter